jgi:hypothetical protein
MPRHPTLKTTKRALTAAAMIAAASAPSSAYARLNLDPETPLGHHQVRLVTPTRPARPVAEAASPSPGFEWGDAGLGAAGMLVLVGTGAGTAAAIGRRRGHRTATS